ncbi:MAG: hypothetical protein AAF458_11355 [Pseudomonadota bacterium]
MTVYIEHMPRPQPARATLRLVSEHRGESGREQLQAILEVLGLGYIEMDETPSQRALAHLPHQSQVRAMHAGAVPISREALTALAEEGRLPDEVSEPNDTLDATA